MSKGDGFYLVQSVERCCRMGKFGFVRLGKTAVVPNPKSPSPTQVDAAGRAVDQTLTHCSSSHGTALAGGRTNTYFQIKGNARQTIGLPGVPFLMVSASEGSFGATARSPLFPGPSATLNGCSQSPRLPHRPYGRRASRRRWHCRPNGSSRGCRPSLHRRRRDPESPSRRCPRLPPWC